ncbi:MAG: tRNA epoxyqueuosine(34) reductase QueG [Pseudomonadota bacterium]
MASDNAASLADAVKSEAAALGFAACGICRPSAIAQAPARLQAFLSNGYHGEMAWMADRANWRGDPAALWPAARSIVMLADSYAPTRDPLRQLERRDRAAISVYSQSRDYHDVVKKRLKRLGRWLIAQAGGEIKVFVDTAPVMEKPLAQAAGLGWIGKHTNLLSRDLGNWVFLGSVFSTLEIDPDPAEIPHCGSCRRCLDICPTAAFPAPFKLDARRCISYLTIEHKGPVPLAMRPLLGNRVFGCDDCLAVCPWNKFSQTAHAGYAARAGLRVPALAELAALDDAAFRARFAGTPVKRIGHNRFLRNVLYAIGNSGDRRLRGAAKAHCSDPDPVVADAACWALTRLAQCQKAPETRLAAAPLPMPALPDPGR